MLNIGTVVIVEGDGVSCSLLTDRDIVVRDGERRILKQRRWTRAAAATMSWYRCRPGPTR